MIDWIVCCWWGRYRPSVVIPFTGQRLDKPGSLVSNQVEHVLVRQGQSCSETRYQFKFMELVEAMCFPKPKFSEKVSIHTGGVNSKRKIADLPKSVFGHDVGARWSSYLCFCQRKRATSVNPPPGSSLNLKQFQIIQPANMFNKPRNMPWNCKYFIRLSSLLRFTWSSSSKPPLH